MTNFKQENENYLIECVDHRSTVPVYSVAGTLGMPWEKAQVPSAVGLFCLRIPFLVTVGLFSSHAGLLRQFSFSLLPPSRKTGANFSEFSILTFCLLP